MKRLLLALALCASLGAQVKLPPYTREVLPNGVVVYYMQRTGLPLVSFRVLVRGGNESDPAAMAGLSSVTAELLRRGTAQRTAAQFSEQIDALGGTFGAGTDEQSTTAYAEFLSKDFNAGLALVADALLAPAFPEEEVRKTLARRAQRSAVSLALASRMRSYLRGNCFSGGLTATRTSLVGPFRSTAARSRSSEYCRPTSDWSFRNSFIPTTNEKRSAPISPCPMRRGICQ
jgi:hypothetical protein